MEASARVSARSRPLTVFYALAQAGRAIVAAHLQDPHPRSHGLTLADPSDDLMSTPIEVQGNGWYQAVSRAVGSSLVKSAELGRIWAAIPDLSRTPLLGATWPKAVQVVRLLDKFSHLSAGTVVAAVLFDPWPSDVNDVRERFKNYPSAGRASAPDVPGLPGQLITEHTGYGPGIRVNFSLQEGEKHIPSLALLESRSAEYRFYDERWLIPAFPEGQVLAPIMLWWTLLFGLSMLARYHPDAWVHALDVNRSTLAVPLEDALDLAMTAVPHLVLEALIKTPVRFRR
jgi:hypothetical protein